MLPRLFMNIIFENYYELVSFTPKTNEVHIINCYMSKSCIYTVFNRNIQRISCIRLCLFV